MDSRLLYLIVSLIILVFCLRFSQAANEDGYIGCFNENLANPILPYQKIPNKNNPVRPNRCRNLCAGYRFFGLRNGTECWCGNADYAFYGAAAETECNLPCGSGNAMCGGYNVSSVYRWSLCSEVCNNHSLLCVDSGVNKEITTCVNCLGNTAGASCQNCIPDYYGFPSTGACQACNCGPGAFNSTCNVQTGQCICGSGFQGLMCDTCIDGKFVSGSTCMDCECGVGSLSNTCNQITGQCTCKNYFTGRTCSECEDGRFVQADACSLCNCGIGASSISCDQTTGQCSCNPNFGGLTCSTCNSGFELVGSECIDQDECALGTHDCGSDATCTNTLGSYTCTCNPGYSGNGRICTDVNECTLPSHNCSASAICTNSIGGFSCECNFGFNGDGYVCTDIDECANPQLCDPQASCINTQGSFTCNCPSGMFGNGFTCSNCTCGFGASSPICNTVTGVCTCLPGFDTPFCNECRSGFFGSNCAACPNCVHGTCNDKLSGDGQCSCNPGWATPLCDICSPGFFGPNCAGVCPSCGHGSCLEGLLGNGSCVCEAGWKISSFCSQCQDGFYLSNDKCLACDPSCKTCSGGSSTQCLSCPVSRVLNSGSCVNLCPSGKFQDSSLICQPCDSTCLECTGSSANSCLSCPSNRIRLGNSCVTQCPQEFYNSTGTCLACHSSCASCDGSTQNDCLTCPTNYFLNPVRGKCVNVCPDGMFPNPNSVCQTCHTSCLTCNGTSDSSCLSCDSGKIYFENRCLASCPTGYSKSPSGTCQKCECNKHATECDAETGECLNCGDNTSGPHCNLCLQDFTPSNTSDGFFCNPPINPTTNSNAISSKPVAIGIGVAVGVLVMALIGIALIIIRSRKVQRIDPGTGKPDFEDVYGSSLDLEMACSTLRNIAGTDSGAPTLLNTEIGKELSLPGYLKMNYQEDIRIEKSLAGGGGGSIFMGSILNPDMRLKYPFCADRIAIKKIFTHDSLTTEENHQLFYQEVSVMSALSYHSNIAKVLFYTEDPNAIVFPLYESDLHRLIHSPSLVYSPPQMRDILLQISMGMQAIHGLEIAHRDLKPANFLLEPNPKAEQDGRFPFTVKITDFGVCHVSHSNVASQKFINVFGVSVKYAAPEVFSRMILKKFEGDIAELMKSDTYSFAISAWELITRKHPWEGLKADDIQAKVVAGERPPLPESTHDPLLATLEDLTRLCWHQEYAKRPTFKDVAAKLVRLF